MQTTPTPQGTFSEAEKPEIAHGWKHLTWENTYKIHDSASMTQILPKKATAQKQFQGGRGPLEMDDSKNKIEGVGGKHEITVLHNRSFLHGK